MPERAHSPCKRLRSGRFFCSMRKLILVTSLLLAVHIALLFTRRSAIAEGKETSPYRIGIVLDVGGRGDKSFNDGAYAGADAPPSELGANVRFIEPGEGADREAGLRLLAAEGMDLVIGVGFIFTDDLSQARQGVSRKRRSRGSTTRSRPTRMETSSRRRPTSRRSSSARRKARILVGAIAALVGKSKKVGFVGGMDIPLIHKFEAGYRAGVKKVCPDCQVIAQYAGVTPDAFKNPGKGKELALSQYNQGVDVIFHASGSTGLGVFEAARATEQARHRRRRRSVRRSPGYVLTSWSKAWTTRRRSTPSVASRAERSRAASTRSA